MDQIQENSLIGGGDCFLHFHSDDRVATQDFLHGLQKVAKVLNGTSNVVLKNEDFVSIDTRTGNITVTMPRAINGREVELNKPYPANTLIIVPQGADTIMQGAGVTISSGGASLRFKAFGTDWRPI